MLIAITTWYCCYAAAAATLIFAADIFRCYSLFSLMLLPLLKHAFRHGAYAAAAMSAPQDDMLIY